MTVVPVGMTEEQELFRSTTARFIAQRCPMRAVRRLIETDTGLPPGYLEEGAALGWLAMFVPEEHGGGSVSGEPVTEAALVAEERGRVLQPGPYVPLAVVAETLARRGSARQRAEVLPDLAAGRRVATWAIATPEGSWDPAAITATALSEGGYRLSGRAGLVQDATLADWFLVSARGPGGPVQFLLERAVPGLEVQALHAHDVTQRFAEVTFDRVEAPASTVVGAPGDEAAVDRQLQVALTLSACETVGALDALFESTRVYALEREAFGRPIGSFQAVKHQLADMSLLLESAKAITAESVRATQASTTDATEIACMVAAWIGDYGIDIAQGCMQVFGGIAFTWEHDLHLFLRRVTMNSFLFGSSTWARERICLAHGL